MSPLLCYLKTWLEEAGDIVQCVLGPTAIQKNVLVAGGGFDAITTVLVSRFIDDEPNLAREADEYLRFRHRV
jgi:hypothetical protein